MSIGSLGSAGQNFRDFLGGSQKDIGRGLQDVLSTYQDPQGEFQRLDQRANKQYQLTVSELSTVYDRDSQNTWSETWYAEYRAVLQLRADSLKKKLNRAFARNIDAAIYAPLKPGTKWAPQANRDINDISAQDPTKLPTGMTPATPPSPPAPPSQEEYQYNDWFSGSSPKSSGNAIDDIRRFINEKAPLADIDGDERMTTFDINTRVYTVNDAGNYMYGATNGDEGSYGVFDSSGNPFSGSAWDGMQAYNNVGPTTTTKFWSLSGNTGDRYFGEIPPGRTANSMPANSIPPSLIGSGPSGSFADGSVPGGTKIETHRTGYSGTWTFTSSGNPPITGGGWFSTDSSTSPSDPSTPPGYSLSGPNWTEYFHITSGTRIFDSVTTNTFGYGNQTGPVNGYVTGLTLNSQLTDPAAPIGVLDRGDDISGSDSSIPIYRKGFVDSWLEARALQRRESQIEAAYQAYLEGSATISETGQTLNSNPAIDYNKRMDQVFTSLGGLFGAAGGASLGGPLGPLASGSSTPPVPSGPPGTPAIIPDYSNITPYGYHVLPSGAPGAPLSGSVNTFGGYMHGRDHVGHGAVPAAPLRGLEDSNSIYGIVYTQLKMAASAVSQAPVCGQTPPTVAPNTPAPSQPASSSVTFAPGGNNTNDLYIPVPVGAGQMGEGNNQNVDINDESGVSGLKDTLDEAQSMTVDEISNLFVGRQWNKVPGFDQDRVYGVNEGAVQYKADTISAHAMALPGWYGGSGDGQVGTALLTLGPPIDGLAIQGFASNLNWGKVDDISNTLLGGSFLRVGGGSASSGITDLDSTTTKYNIGVGIGVGVGGIFWGHTSSLGRVKDIANMMTSTGPVMDVLGAALGTIGMVGGAGDDKISVFPNIGLGGFSADFNIPIPIPMPTGPVTFINIPMTTYGGASMDLMSYFLEQYLNELRHKILDSVSVYSYATTGGYAMDAYTMRGEYNFIDKGAMENFESMPGIGPMSFGTITKGVMELMLTLSTANGETVNGADVKERLLRTKHSYGAAESREVDTGAFFAASAFLSQFAAHPTDTTERSGLRDLEYSYWTGAQQNEEVANMDLLRMVAVSGKELMTAMSKAMFTSSGQKGTPTSVTGVALNLVINMVLGSLQNSIAQGTMWDILFHDQQQTSFSVMANIKRSSFTSEGYDFIEDDKKIFESDYEGASQTGAVESVVGAAFGKFPVPNTVIDGYANTRRYKPEFRGVDTGAGRQGYARSEYQKMGYTDQPDENTQWDIHVGFWGDTGLGDINEVYTRKNIVSWGTNTLTGGISDSTTQNPTVKTYMNRYVGSNNRIYGRGYDGAKPLNLAKFRTGYFASKYFGTLVGGANTTAFGVASSEAITIDGRAATLYLFKGQGSYDRLNDYSIKATLADGTNLNLKAESALAPSLGGRIKLGSLDMNTSFADPDTTAGSEKLGYDMNNQQNALQKELYRHMYIYEDHSNAQLVREFRDAFNMGLLDDIFVTASGNAPTGGGITASARVRFTKDGPGVKNPLGADTLMRHRYFENAGRGRVEIFLDSFSVFKRKAKSG